MTELKIKVKLGQVNELEKTVEIIKKIEKEYNCNCTLLEVEIG
jgi:hypothetical protein